MQFFWKNYGNGISIIFPFPWNSNFHLNGNGMEWNFTFGNGMEWNSKLILFWKWNGMEFSFWKWNGMEIDFQNFTASSREQSERAHQSGKCFQCARFMLNHPIIPLISGPDLLHPLQDAKIHQDLFQRYLVERANG